MGHKFAEIAFTESVREMQRTLGSGAGYAAMDDGEDYNDALSGREASFIAARDSFYIASVGETGWPYVQHRGGPAGFVRVLDEHTIGFADFRGNRQYVTVGNVRMDDRVALFLIDYPNRIRLKIFGRVRLVGDDEPELLARLEVDDYRASVERGFVIRIEAFDWNCPQHITPRFTEAEIETLIAPLIEKNRAFKSAGAAARATSRVALGNGPLELVVSGVRQLTPRVRAYELRDPEGRDLPAVQAGAHIQVPVRLENGKVATRNYSISSDPTHRDAYEIAVLREDKGTGGSRAVHDFFEIGLRLRCGLPRNDFTLHDDARPAVLIAGGIGITPIKAMAHVLKARGTAVHLHYAARSRREAAYREELVRELDASLRLYDADEGQRMDVDGVLATAPADAVFYVCGPQGLINAVLRFASERGIAPERTRFERFAAFIAPDAKPIEVELRRSGQMLQVRSDQTILDAALAAGIDAAYSCRAGTCKTCAVEVIDGEPDHRDSALSPVERERHRLMCPCVSHAKSDRLVLDM